MNLQLDMSFLQMALLKLLLITAVLFATSTNWVMYVVITVYSK